MLWARIHSNLSHTLPTARPTLAESRHKNHTRRQGKQALIKPSWPITSIVAPSRGASWRQGKQPITGSASSSSSQTRRGVQEGPGRAKKSAQTANGEIWIDGTLLSEVSSETLPNPSTRGES